MKSVVLFKIPERVRSLRGRFMNGGWPISPEAGPRDRGFARRVITGDLPPKRMVQECLKSRREIKTALL